ncbi:hypothetical protein CDV36_010488 [Fusarium kuroshium]|uniref:G domain-containing protein n=1 Tax=Fusarium kuroshium TaxID=2010991 RepID=A0A3M2RX67_9HYPO|nr:hypothetical protein CDV36_010488 [Fusarium kuroshium]
MELASPESFSLSPNDVVIAVMGVTGAGKSTFIGKVTGQDVKVGHSLVSHTAAVGVFPYQQSQNRCIYLVDTPGFDDTTRTDIEVLKDVAFFLSQIYRKDVKLAGIVYLHRITDNRVRGSSMKNLKMFQQLCGDEAFGHVILATSMWDTLEEASKDVGDQREQELMSRAEFWGTMYKSGSQVARWLGNEQSAQSIVGKIIEVHDKAGEAVLKIQQEMVNEDKDLDETAAGREVQREIAAAKAQLQEEIKELREMQEDMIKQSNEKLAQEFATQRQRIEKQLKDANEAQSSLKISLETLLEEKTAEYEEMLNRAQEEQRRMAEALKEKEADIWRAQQERAEDEKMFREAQAQYAEEVKELARKIEQQQREAERQRREYEERQRQMEEERKRKEEEERQRRQREEERKKKEADENERQRAEEERRTKEIEEKKRKIAEKQRILEEKTRILEEKKRVLEEQQKAKEAEEKQKQLEAKMRSLLEEQEEMKRQQREEQEAALRRQRMAEAQMESQRARKQSQKQAMGLFGVVAGVGTAALGVLTVNPGLVSVGAAWASNSANNM